MVNPDILVFFDHISPCIGLLLCLSCRLGPNNNATPSLSTTQTQKQKNLTGINMRIHKHLQGIAAALVLVTLTACSTTPTEPSSKIPDQPTATTGVNLYDSFMEEERQWAGLVTKKVKILDNLEITYSESLNTTGPLVIMLHGYYGDRNNWNRVAHQLQNKYHLIIPDLPGHGDSDPHPEDNYTFPEFASIMNKFVNALNLPPFHIAGHSMGGGVAIQWSMIRHKDMKSLILVDTAGIYRNNDTEAMKKIIARDNAMRIAAPGDAVRLLNVAMNMPPFIPESVMQAFEAKQISKLAIYDKVMDDMLKTQDTLDPDYFAIALKVFERPSLVLWGEQDHIFSVNVTPELTAALPNDTLVILENIGHTPMLEAAWPTSKAIKDFLEMAEAKRFP